MNDKIWYKLLYYWSYSKKPIGSGLTIPFLIGAINDYSDPIDVCSIRKLIQDFADINLNNYQVSIRFCTTIGTLVCCLENLIEEELIGAKKIGNLYLMADSLNYVSINELVEYLENKFNDYITNANYSISNGKWNKFSKTDKETIEKVLTNK